MMYKNHEGYADPTAGQALANIRREEKARRGYMPLVYICSPFRGDVENNMRNARKYCAFALSRHALPIATHLLFPQFMGTKETPQTREMALHMALILLTRCNELWYFGDTVSEGMWTPKRVLDLLKNEKYAGNALLQKKYVPDHLSKSEKINHGELPKYFSEGTHEAIIAPEIFERVQAQIERNRRKNNIARIAPQHSIFTGRIVCCQCGKRYQRKVTRSEVAWNCATFLRLGKAYCHTKQIPEEILKQETAAVLGLCEFNEAVFDERIAEIRVPAFNHLIFVFRDGTQTERVWQDKSRRDSWTEDMRLRAAEHARKRHVKEGGEQ